MNCKPGDLAVVVTTLGYRDLDDCLGKIFRLKAVAMTDRFGPKWSYDGARQSASHGEITHIADACLRPIRPQDDDATDETLLWQEVPSKDKEPA